MSVFDDLDTFEDVPDVVKALSRIHNAEYWNCHPEECSTEVFKYLNDGKEPKDFAVRNGLVEVRRTIDAINFFKSQVEPYFNFNKILSRNVAFTSFYSDDDLFPINNITNDFDLYKVKRFPSPRAYAEFAWDFFE